jgi:hypothetical protein
MSDDTPRTQDAGRVWTPQKRRRMSKRRWRIVNPHWKRRSVRCVVRLVVGAQRSSS